MNIQPRTIQNAALTRIGDPDGASMVHRGANDLVTLLLGHRHRLAWGGSQLLFSVRRIWAKNIRDVKRWQTSLSELPTTRVESQELPNSETQAIFTVLPSSMCKHICFTRVAGPSIFQMVFGLT